MTVSELARELQKAAAVNPDRKVRLIVVQHTKSGRRFHRAEERLVVLDTPEVVGLCAHKENN